MFFLLEVSMYDAAVSGADPIDRREGFADLLQGIATNGVRIVIVETANRFARDLIVQETGYRLLKTRGIDLIAADSPAAFLDDGPTSRLIRQILGAVAEFDKAMTVAKLKGARERKRNANGWCEAGLPLEQRYPHAIVAAKKLYRKHPKTGKRRSLRQISAVLAAQGHLMTAKYRGVDQPRPFNPATIAPSPPNNVRKRVSRAPWRPLRFRTWQSLQRTMTSGALKRPSASAKRPSSGY